MGRPIAEEVRVDNDGVELAMSMVGEGPDLLFVHGLGSAQVLWDPLVDELADRWRCWTLDLRGHGASSRAPGGYTDAGYESDVAAALDHIGSPTFAIGHSLGGRSIVRVAARGQRNLTGVYVLDSNLLPRDAARPSALAKVFGAQLDMLRRFQPEERPVDDYAATLAAAPYVGGGTNADRMVPAQLWGRAASLSQLDPECLEVVLEGGSGAAFVPPAVAVPLRVIAADPDLGASFRPEHDGKLRSYTPHATVRRVEGVGHQLMMVEGFDELIRDDLQSWLAAR